MDKHHPLLRHAGAAAFDSFRFLSLGGLAEDVGEALRQMVITVLVTWFIISRVGLDTAA
ncbi:MAG: hypothetical protein Ct9H300mP15_20110 [Gemmatimonadota bacterium]|nr:MAG: hypothetical protein Ct9H300mP15_20110 [Gemmatimonadota bacterium]